MTVLQTTGDVAAAAIDPSTRAATPASSRRLVAVVAIVALGWLGFILAMLLRSSVPDLGPQMRFGRGPSGHLAMAAVLGFLVTTVTSLVRRWPPAAVAWYSTLATAVLVTVLEVAQIPVPVRAFEMDDLVYGVTGGVLGTAAAAAIMTIAGRRFLLRLVAVGGLITLLGGVAIAAVIDSVAVKL